MESTRGAELLAQLQTGEDPRDLGHSDVSALRTLLSSDLYAFCVGVFQFGDLIDSLHGEMCEIIKHWGQVRLADGSWTYDPLEHDEIAADYRRVMIMVPRDSFKTSVCTRANALWQICREPDKTVIIFNERADNARKWLRGIREVVESNLLFRVVYADLLPPGKGLNDSRTTPRSWKWSDEYLQFERGSTGTPETSITASGVGAASAGGHWHKVIKDDLISEDAVRGKEATAVLRSAIEWYDRSLYLERPAMHGWELISCTPWMHGDLYDHILENYDVQLYRRSALEDANREPDLNGEPIFPEKLTKSDVLRQYERDPEGTWSQLMCVPRVGGDQLFDKQWYRAITAPIKEFGRLYSVIDTAHYDPAITQAGPDDIPPQEVPFEWIDRAVLLDPATSRKSQRQAQRLARNGLVCAGVDPFGRRHVFEAQSFRKEHTDTLHTVIDLCLRWQTDKVAIEEVVFSEVYRPFLQYILEREYDGLELNIIPVAPQNRTKEMRVHRLAPLMRQGYYYFVPEYTQTLLQELSEYPSGLRVDMIDALAYLDDVCKPPMAPTDMEVSHYQELIRQSGQDGRDSVTGY